MFAFFHNLEKYIQPPVRAELNLYGFHLFIRLYKHWMLLVYKYHMSCLKCHPTVQPSIYLFGIMNFTKQPVPWHECHPAWWCITTEGLWEMGNRPYTMSQVNLSKLTRMANYLYLEAIFVTFLLFHLTNWAESWYLNKQICFSSCWDEWYLTSKWNGGRRLMAV